MLNLNPGGGDFNPYLKYNAKAGRFYVKDPKDINGGEVEVVNLRMAIDFDNVKQGWLLYQEGAAPQRLWDVNGVRQPRPADIGLAKWKEGFEVAIYGGDVIQALGDKLGLREFGGSSGSLINAILKAYAQYSAGRAANPGAVPIYTTTGTVPIKSKNGTNYEPVFVLEKWVPRAAIPAFDGVKPSSPQPMVASGAPPAATVTLAPPPPPVTMVPPPVAAPVGVSSEF